jgi:DNA-binding IclR family transcriptional regulator
MKIEGRGVQSIEVGGKLLAALVRLSQPAMLRDVAAAAEMTAAQAHAYLVSYRKLGLVDQDPATGRYLLGPFALQLGLARMRSFDPLRLAARATADLAAEMGLMATVAVWGTHGPTIIQVQEAAQPVHVNLRAGAVYTITGTATGRLFAAFLSESVTRPMVDEELKAGGRGRRIGQAIPWAAIDADLAEIRLRGHAVTEGVPVPGVNAVSAPVFDHAGALQFAITVIGYAAALDVGPDSPQVGHVAAVAVRLSGELGFRPAP